MFLTDKEMRDLEKLFHAERVRTSDEEYLIIYPGEYGDWQRAIEAAVLAKLNSAEPVAWQISGGKFNGRLLQPFEYELNVHPELERWKVCCVPLYLHPPAPSAVKHLQTQLESEKVSHAAWEKQSLLEYSEVVQERNVLKDALEGMVEIARLTIGWSCTPENADGPLVVAERLIARVKGGAA